MPPYQIIEGRKSGHVRYVIDGYIFTGNSSSPNFQYVLCRERHRTGCKVRARIVKNSSTNEAKFGSHVDHNHDPPAPAKKPRAQPFLSEARAKELNRSGPSRRLSVAIGLGKRKKHKNDAENRNAAEAEARRSVKSELVNEGDATDPDLTSYTSEVDSSFLEAFQSITNEVCHNVKPTAAKAAAESRPKSAPSAAAPIPPDDDELLDEFEFPNGKPPKAEYLKKNAGGVSFETAQGRLRATAYEPGEIVSQRATTAFDGAYLATQAINLNVGGKFYTTTLSTLTQYPNSRLAGMFAGLSSSSCREHNFIDRDGPSFRHILNFLRNGRLRLPENFQEADLLIDEAQYFGLTEMAHAVSLWRAQQ